MKQNNFNAVRCAHYPLLGTLLWQFGLIWPHSDNKTVGRSKLTIFLLGGALKHVWCLLYIFNIFHGLVLTSLLDINFTRVSMSLSCCSAQERYTILWALRWARVVCCGWSEHWKSWSWFQLVKDIGKQGMAYHGFLASNWVCWLAVTALKVGAVFGLGAGRLERCTYGQSAALRWRLVLNIWYIGLSNFLSDQRQAAPRATSEAYLELPAILRRETRTSQVSFFGP